MLIAQYGVWRPEGLFVYLYVRCFTPWQHFLLYHGGDMMYEMRKLEPTLLLIQGLSNLPHHIGMVLEELAFDETISYTQWGNGLQHS